MLHNKRSYMTLIGLALLFALTAQSAFAQSSTIVSSKHNFSTNSSNTIKSVPLASGGTSEICVFCHTPHYANTSLALPLWNKALGTTTYTTYTSDYLTALGYPTAAQPKVKSKLCLSCHDGTLALGSVYNLPGSGGSTGGTIPMQTGTTAITTLPTTSTGHLGGANLADDHPVGYTYITGSLAGQDTELVVRAWPWPTSTTGTVTSVKLDPNASTGTVECYTCHDPHNNQFTYFLRMDNTNAGLCTYCHNKTGYSTSIHSTSTATFITPTGTTTTIGNRSCINCHKPHTALGTPLLRGAEENTCYDSGCHGTSVTGRTATTVTNNIQLDMGKVRAHPTNTTPSTHKDLPFVAGTGAELPAAFSSPSNRHAECPDCHNPHQAQAAVEKSVRGNIRISAALKGMWGVQPSWPAPSTTLANNKVAFATGETYTVLSRSGSADVNPVIDEYQVCMKCHSNYVTLPTGARNIAQEINPNNSSYHGIVPGGQTNYFVNSTTMAQPWGGTAIFVANSAKAGSPPTVGSTEYIRQNPSTAPVDYANRGRVWCSDCHGSDASTLPPVAGTKAAPYGAHGSANNGTAVGTSNSDRMLVRSIVSATGTYTPLCLGCHLAASYASGNTGSRMNRHGANTAYSTYGCFTCHMWEDPTIVTGGTGQIFPHGMNKRWATIGTTATPGSLQMVDAFVGGAAQTNIDYATKTCWTAASIAGGTQTCSRNTTY